MTRDYLTPGTDMAKAIDIQSVNEALCIIGDSFVVPNWAFLPDSIKRKEKGE